MADTSQRTEKPTPKRLREAREKGQIARSADIGAWSGMLATTVLLQITVSRGARAFSEIFAAMGEAVSSADQGSASRFATNAMWKAAGVAAPLLIGMMVVGTAAGLAQVGLRPSLKRLKPDFKRLNPLKGLKRLVSAGSWWEVAKSVLKTAMLVAVAWPAIAHVTTMFSSSSADTLDEIAALTATTALVIIRNVAMAGLAIAGLDYVVQRRRVMKQVYMTRQELKEEMKQMEGNPEMRRVIRSRQMAMTRNRMLRMMGLADVVLVNPTHYAVALRYQPDRGAPEVIAKGAGHLAMKIRAAAAKHGVPVVHEPVLTRALYRASEVGHLIPINLYEAVAHVLAFVFGLRAKGRAHGYHEFESPVLV